MDELYFCVTGTESDHFGLSEMLLDQCGEVGCELRYYRELKNGHIPMWREVKVVGPRERLNRVRGWLRDNYVRFRTNPYKDRTGLSRNELAEVEGNIKRNGMRVLPEGYPLQFTKNEAVVRRGLVPIEECPMPSWACSQWATDEHRWIACKECCEKYEVWLYNWLDEVE